MAVSKADLLQLLPPFTNSSLLIEDNQDVPDIIREVLNAHEHFAGDYDAIYQYFTRPTVERTCKALFDFCKENIRYVIEGEENQSTRSPAAILAMGYGDCKHYAAFIAGVLCAINRNTGQDIKWSYRFASYDVFNKIPGHVFVVVKDGPDEIWIDPVLRQYNERYLPAHHIDKNVNSMALVRIAGTDSGAVLTADAIPDLDILPDLTYQLDPEDANLSPELLSAIHLLLYYNIIDAEGNVNDNLLLGMEANTDPQTFAALVNARQLLNTAQVSGFLDSVWRGVKKVTMSIPRSAYLSLVALNIFGTATKLAEATKTQSDIDKVRGKWYSLGGDWQALENAIRNGSKKKRIFGIGAAAVALPAWVTAATAIIAAMTPIIMGIIKQRQAAGVLDPGFDKSWLNEGNGLPNQGGDFMTFIKENMLWIAGGGVLVWYYLKNRKR